jgi:acetyl esterase/lipase
MVALPASASAIPPREPVPGAPAPGPAKYDRQFVRKYGPASARTVLVLQPGSPSGQSNFDLLAPELVARVRGLQVWTVDRRSNAFEDPTGFESGDPDTAGLYYAGLTPIGGRTFAPVPDSEAPYVRRWGAEVALEDIRRVVLRARDHGRRRVLLGGHSTGAVLTMAYAVWDFHGRPGYKDVDGLVFIDGALLGAFDAYLRGTLAAPIHTVARAKEVQSTIDSTSPFGSVASNSGIPAWVTGILPELACQFALNAPDAPSTLQAVIDAVGAGGVLPPGTLPPGEVTNAGLMTYLFTQGPSAFRTRVATPAASLGAVCRTFITEPGNGMEWYFPSKIETDTLGAMEPLRPTPVTRYFGLRPFHLADVDVPVYGFATALSEGGVTKAYRRFVRGSKVPFATLRTDDRMGHLDPLMDRPASNSFLTTVVPFLRRFTGRSRPAASASRTAGPRAGAPR